MLQEIVNAKDKANKDLEEIVEGSQRSYNELWGQVRVKEQKFNKELQAKDVKLQSLELMHKTLGKLTDWEKINIENQVEALLYEQLVGQIEPNVTTTLEEGQAEMKRWHFDQTKGYVKALDATYVRIQELENQIEEEKLMMKKNMKKRWKQQTNLKMMKQLPMGKYL